MKLFKGLDEKFDSLAEKRGELWEALERDLHTDDTNHKWRAEMCAGLASIELEIDALEARKSVARLIHYR